MAQPTKVADLKDIPPGKYSLRRARRRDATSS